MIKTTLLLICILLHCSGFSEKVLIVTSAYNRPDFIEIQNKTFKKFLKDEYEFVVFNDARQKDLQSAIKKTCSKLGIRCVNIPQSIHNQPYLYRLPKEDLNAPAVRNANVVQYALNNLGFSHKGIVAIVDSDMFLVKDFSITEFLQGFEIAGVPQGYEKNGIRIPYLWIGIAFLDMTKLPNRTDINFNCGNIKGVPVDAGGYTYYYLHEHPELNIRYFPSLHSPNLFCPSCLNREESHTCTHNRIILENAGFDEDQIYFLQSGLQNVEFFIRGTFFHYRSGTNWDYKTKEFHEKKTQIFNAYIDKILKN